MSAKQQLAEAIAELPDTLSIGEAVERLYRAFKLKQAHERARTQPVQGSDAQVASMVSQLRQLLDEQRITEARDLAAQLPPGPWSTFLAPPRASVASEATGPGLREPLIDPWALAPYVGQWVAFRGGQVIDAAPRRSELRRALNDRNELTGCIFLYVEP